MKKEIKFSTIKVRLGAVHRFKELFSVHARETYNDIIERAIEDGSLYPPNKEGQNE